MVDHFRLMFLIRNWEIFLEVTTVKGNLLQQRCYDASRRLRIDTLGTCYARGARRRDGSRAAYW